MSQKIASFFRTSWFPILTIIGMAIHGYYTMNYAQRDLERDMIEIKREVEKVRELKATVIVNTNDISQLKRSVFDTDRTLEKMERNLDRVVWVVDELARKNGITPPKQITEYRP